MKKIIALLMTFCLFFVLAACDVNKVSQKISQDVEKSLEDAGVLEESPKPNEGEATFTVIVIHKDGTEKTFTYTTTEPYVGPVLTEEGLIEGNAGPYGLEITKVDGEQAIYAQDNAYWAVYEGEEYAMQGIDTTPVVDGAVYKLVYTGA